ncbi:MAG: hypothetical protein PF904_10780 [Kiritimatiellae bacterium]|jgi:GxxExxY protein|nr:hypothetical protein [Kiritimatiellia bacterium]
MKNDELTENIIGCAYKVYYTMGFGYLEFVYEKCFKIEKEVEDSFKIIMLIK